jgi:cell division protein FtsN
LQVIQTMAKPRRTTKQQSKQSGGTFLGVVLGLIVGLAIAVVVALYITRSPTPFVSKVAPPAASDASQSEQYDPNRPLQGKTPGQPVTPQAAQSTPPNTAPGQTTNQSQSSGMLDEPQIVEVPPSGSTDNSANNAANNGVAVAPKPSTGNTADTTQPAKKPQPSSQPAQQLANNQPQKSPNAIPAPNAAKPAQPGSAAPSAADANTGYFLQVGAYKTSSDAEQQRARLAFQGFESKVTQRDAGGITYYRVRIGPFSKFDDMNSTRQRLSDAGIDTAVIRFSKQ